jgi:hypothetical protein
MNQHTFAFTHQLMGTLFQLTEIQSGGFVCGVSD